MASLALPEEKEIGIRSQASSESSLLGLVLSGGGSRTAYQVGALRALGHFIAESPEQISIIVGSSVGAVNTVVLSACLQHGLLEAVDVLNSLWQERTYRNTFKGSPSRSFLRAIQVAVLRYSSPGPSATSLAIFDPEPLRQRVDQAIDDARSHSAMPAVNPVVAAGVMATIEGKDRKPLLFVSTNRPLSPEQMIGASFAVSYVEKLTAAHGFGSAALPSVLPPVKLNSETGEVRLIDGGISDNVPVDPAVRMGASRIISIDTSGRRWWFDHYGTPYDTRPTWEVAAGEQTFCMCPAAKFEIRSTRAFGPLLRDAVGRSTSDFISSLGPTWPIFRILKHKMGEDLAYEIMSYVALHPQYFDALIELGYNETKEALRFGFPLALHSGSVAATCA